MHLPDCSKALEILQTRISLKESNNPSLFSGIGGKVLFYAYLDGVHSTIDYKSLLNDSIQEVLDNLSQKTNDPSFADGYTGIAWLLQHIVNESLSDEISSEMVSGFDRPIISSLSFYQKNFNYDPLYGAIGAGIYFIERGGIMIPELTSVIELLMQINVVDENKITWLDRFTNSDTDPQYNIGLSHGVTGIIIFLIKSYHFIKERAPEQEQLLEQLFHTIHNSLTWLIDKELPYANSNFPNTAYNLEESRLGWSYGDLGIAYCILLAADLFDSDIWNQKGQELALSTLNRTVQNSHIYLDHHQIPDAGICNGSAGIALLYNSLFILTRNNLFAEKSGFWHSITVSSILEAHKIYGNEDVPVSKIHWWNDLSLIRGLSGIGLSLVKNDQIGAGWKKPFLLI